MSKIKIICQNTDGDFVGINYEKEEVKIYFPIGYQIPENEKEKKNSILDLIKAINLVKSEKTDKEYSSTMGDSYDIPLNSYIWLINNYLANGLYYDLEKRFKQKINGKINWKRTVKTKAYLSENNIVYLNPIKEKSSKEENIITMIEIFCLKKSIEKVGFLFNEISLPKTGLIEKNTLYYLSLLKKKLANTYIDHKKRLLNNMIIIVEEACNEKIKNKDYKYGTYHFNIAWEKMVDRVYGNVRSKDFFPNAEYHIITEKRYKTSEMLPDTILNYQNNLYILDSKYYKYGITASKHDLPGTDSIAKQIIYAKYADSKICRKKHPDYRNVYNAFILPFNKEETFKSKETIKYIGYAENGFENSNKEYEHISLLLIDTKYLMDCYFNHEKKDKAKLVKNIVK